MQMPPGHGSRGGPRSWETPAMATARPIDHRRGRTVWQPRPLTRRTATPWRKPPRQLPLCSKHKHTSSIRSDRSARSIRTSDWVYPTRLEVLASRPPSRVRGSTTRPPRAVCSPGSTCRPPPAPARSWGRSPARPSRSPEWSSRSRWWWSVPPRHSSAPARSAISWSTVEPDRARRVHGGANEERPFVLKPSRLPDRSDTG